MKKPIGVVLLSMLAAACQSNAPVAITDTKAAPSVEPLQQHGDMPLDLQFSGDIKTRAVFAEDSREPMPLDQYPWSAVGRIEVGDGHCTGSLIAPDLVLTNAHCVMNAVDDDSAETTIRLPQNVRFYPAYHPQGTPMHSAGQRIWLDDLVMERGLNNISGQYADWAIIRLRQPLGDRFGWLDIAASSHTGTVSLGGYSGDHEDGRVALVHRNCNITELNDDTSVVHDCDMTAGASGSPIIAWQGERAEITALNSAEAGNKRTGTRYHMGVEFSESAFNIAVSPASFSRQLSYIPPLPSGEHDYQITLCNDIDEDVRLMLAHHDDDKIMAFGPVPLASGNCSEVHMGNRPSETVFVRYEGRDTTSMGDQPICASPGSLVLTQLDEQCDADAEKHTFTPVQRPESGYPLMLSSLPQQQAAPQDSGKQKGRSKGKRKGKGKTGPGSAPNDAPNVIR